MTAGRGLLVLAVLAGAAAVILTDRGPGAAPGDTGNPCVQPVPWRIGDVDPGFGVSPDEVRTAVQAAVGLWEAPAGRTLFRHDPDDGIPIVLVYDERQEALERREARVRQLREAENAVLRLRADYARRAGRLQALVASHNQGVDAWNRARGGTGAERSRLEAQRREIEELRASLDRAEAALQDAIGRYNDLVADSDAGPLRVEAGNFEETIREARGRRTRTRARLVVYQFDGSDDLVRVLAHELGHALGLGHVADPGALMFQEYASGGEERAGLTDADIAALVERCGLTAWSEAG